MDIELARHLTRAAFRSSRAIGDFVPFLKEKLVEEEYTRYAKAIGSAIASIQLDVVNLLIADHPGLEAEIEQSIDVYGSYFEAGASTVIASRKLKLREENGETEIPIRIHAPEQENGAWICRFEIDWPDGKAGMWGAGEDSVQALLLALQMIGALIYTSDYHKAGQLSWYDDGAGYGFPVTNGIRDLLTGHDATHL